MAERGAVFLGEVVIANCFAAQCEAWGLFSEERGIFGVDEDALDDAWCEFAGGAFVDEGAIGTEDDLILSRVAREDQEGSQARGPSLSRNASGRPSGWPTDAEVAGQKERVQDD